MTASTLSRILQSRLLHCVSRTVREESGLQACFSGRNEIITACAGLDCSRRPFTQALKAAGLQYSTLCERDCYTSWLDYAPQTQQRQSVHTKLTVKTTTKSHRFSHHIKIDRELELRSYWKDTRGVENPAFLQRYINFSRIYARFRDLEYLKYTMRDWDTAIDRLFDHDRGMQPANDLARKHPYLLNVKILPLQFAKNATKGKLPLYDWRKVLRDLRLFVGEDVFQKEGAAPRTEQDLPFQHAKMTAAASKKEPTSNAA